VTLLVGKEKVIRGLRYVVLIVMSWLVILFLNAVVTLNTQMALEYFVYIMVFLNIIFFVVYFIPIGIVGRTFSLPFATSLIILLNVLVFIPSRPEIDNGLYESLILRYGDLHVINFLTSMFHHADFSHLFFNMLFLWIFGSYLEDRIGWRRMVAFYLLTGLVAAFGQMFFTILSEPETWREHGCLGASGAISGIMGVFLMRCRHTKIMFIPNPYIVHIVGFPKLNSTLFVVFSFLTDLFIGFFILTGMARTSIGVFAHLTGFLTGMLLSRTQKMKKDAKVEGLFNSALEDLQPSTRDVQRAEEKLLEVIAHRTDFAEAYLHLARIFSMRVVASADGQNTVPAPQGRQYYETAIKLYVRTSWKTVGEVFKEYFRKYMMPLNDLRLHMYAAKALIRLKEYNMAERALEAVTKEIPGVTREGRLPFLEEAYFLQGKLLEKLGMEEPAIHVYEELLKIFPRTQFREVIVEEIKRMGKKGKEI